MVLRQRIQYYGTISGRMRVAGDAWGTSVQSLGTSFCEDWHTEQYDPSDKALLISHDRRSGGVLNGHRSTLSGPDWENYPYPTDSYSVLLPATDLFTTNETEAASALRAKAMTNPSRNEIQLPVFLWELKDLPGMIRQAGQFLLKPSRSGLQWNAFEQWFNRGRPQGGAVDTAVQMGASAYIAYNFGWAPLVSDLKKLIFFADAVQARRKEFQRLESGTGLKRRVKLLEHSSPVSSAMHTFSSVGNTVLKATVYKQSFIRRWATLRWKPTGNPLPSSDDDIRNVILGLNASSIAGHVWEALPWSWLVDYFTQVGTLIGASNNAVGARLVSSCVMSTSSRRVWHPNYRWVFGNGDVITISAAERTVEHKRRYTSLPGITGVTKFSLLGEKQLSILGALAFQRMSR